MPRRHRDEALAAAASQAEFDRLIRRAPQLWSKDDLCEFYQELSSHCGVWDDEGLAEAHAELDGEEEFEVEQRFLSRFGMSEYYGSEGFDRAPAVGRVLVRRWLLRRERLSPWYDVGYVVWCTPGSGRL